MRGMMKTGNEALVSFLWSDDLSKLFDKRDNKAKLNNTVRSSDALNNRTTVQSDELSPLSITITAIIVILAASLPVLVGLYICKSFTDKIF